MYSSADLDVNVPQLLAELHTVLKQVLLGRGNVNLRLDGLDLSLAELVLSLKYGKQALDANANAYARHLAALGIKHANEIVIATTSCHAAYTHLLISAVWLWHSCLTCNTAQIHVSLVNIMQPQA